MPNDERILETMPVKKGSLGSTIVFNSLIW